jgi:chloride channel 3/4/5
MPNPGPTSLVDVQEELIWQGQSPQVHKVDTSATVPLASSSNTHLPPQNGAEIYGPSENTRLDSNDTRHYGTLPSRRRTAAKPSAPRRANSNFPVPNLNALHRAQSFTKSVPYSPASFRDISFARLSTRPKSTYDAPLQTKDGESPEPDAQVNGIRVWYSSFTSIDWLHDTIKDSARFSRLRRRKSMRARIRLIFDKSLGWLIVTIVGFLTALIAFFVVRCEQLLFDMKEGYCRHSWWKAKGFCCPSLEDLEQSEEEMCPNWRTWSDVLSKEKTHGDTIIDYGSYISVAVRKESLRNF